MGEIRSSFSVPSCRQAVLGPTTYSGTLVQEQSVAAARCNEPKDPPCGSVHLYLFSRVTIPYRPVMAKVKVGTENCTLIFVVFQRYSVHFV